MVGVPAKWGKVQITATIYQEHAEILDKILNKEYNKPIAHKSASEIIRKAIEYYATFLGVMLKESRD